MNINTYTETENTQIHKGTSRELQTRKVTSCGYSHGYWFII